MKKSLTTKSKAALLCTVAVLTLVIGGMYTVYAYAQEEESTTDQDGWRGFGMRGRGMPFGRMREKLTEEQRNELFSEIQDLVMSKYEEWGLELPEPLLSEEQRDLLQAEIEQLREDGATPEEIRDFITEQLEEWGVELPEMPEGTCRFQGRGRFMNGPSGGMWKRRFNEGIS